MPIYNSESFLFEAIKSITSQDLNSIELICVDDGSDDESLEIALSLSHRDSRIVVIRQNHNGPGAARNRGMQVARGRYIYFFDSDDILEQGALRCMVERAESDFLDVVLCNGTAFADEDLDEELVRRESAYLKRMHEYPGVYSGCELWELMNRNDETRVSPYLQLFRRDFLEKERLLYKEGVIHEDDAFSVMAQLLSARSGFVNLPLVRRRLRPGSIVTSGQTVSSTYGTFISAKVLMEFYFSSRGSEKARFLALKHAEVLTILARSSYKRIDECDRYFYRELPRDEIVLFRMLVLNGQ